jgi:hypothetical protein
VDNVCGPAPSASELPGVALRVAARTMVSQRMVNIYLIRDHRSCRITVIIIGMLRVLDDLSGAYLLT